MEFFSQTYVALRGPTGAPQTPTDTIGRLSDRLSPATLLADRRAAVLALKGLSRDCKQEVGERSLPGLLESLQNDAEVDADIGKAILETLDILCQTEDATPGSKELGFRHTDALLSSEKTTHMLFSLLGDTNFYIRFATLQFLTTLLHNRRQAIQGYFLTAPAGPGSIIAVLEDKREIIRNGECDYAEVEKVIHSEIRGDYHGSSPDTSKPRYSKSSSFRRSFRKALQHGDSRRRR